MNAHSIFSIHDNFNWTSSFFWIFFTSNIIHFWSIAEKRISGSLNYVLPNFQNGSALATQTFAASIGTGWPAPIIWQLLCATSISSVIGWLNWCCTWTAGEFRSIACRWPDTVWALTLLVWRAKTWNNGRPVNKSERYSVGFYWIGVSLAMQCLFLCFWDNNSGEIAYDPYRAKWWTWRNKC